MNLNNRAQANHANTPGDTTRVRAPLSPPPSERLTPGPDLPMRGSLAVFQLNVCFATAPAVVDPAVVAPARVT